MAEEILNTLGFKVDDALKALADLDNALRTDATSLGTFANALDDFNSRSSAALSTMRGLATAAKSLAAAMQTAPAVSGTAKAADMSLWLPPGVREEVNALNADLAKAGNTGQAAGQKIKDGIGGGNRPAKDARGHLDNMVVSLNTINRIVQTQLIVRFMSQMRDALHESVTAAIDFQNRLAEIQTIAPRLGAGFQAPPMPLQAMGAETTQYAKDYNVPLPQVEEGLYQTLSNQFTTLEDRTNVMTAAIKLARVGVMDFQSAILLITGTLNAYQMSSSQAESVAMKFFETIRLGRVRGKELADTMGQVIPVASELGVSLDELNAAMVAMTIGGIDAHKTTTALRGAMTAFLKPSEDMKKVIREMGFSDPAQLIAAKGFQGALQAISDAAGGMGSKIAESFRNVRALTAELRLTSEGGARQYQEALKAMAAATPESLSKIFQEFRSTDAERLTSQINAIKVNLTQGFGQAFLKVLADIGEFVGGADKASAVIVALTAAAVPCAAALGVLATAFMVLNTATGPVGIAIVAITAAVAALAGSYAYNSAMAIAAINNEAAARQAATLKTLQAAEQQIAKWKEVQDAEAKASRANWEEKTSALRRSYFQSLDDLKTKNADTINTARQTMDSMIGAQERVVGAYRSAANAAATAAREARNSQESLKGLYQDTQFKFLAAKGSPEEQVRRYMQRSMQLSQEATSKMSQAGTPEQITRADDSFSRAKAHAEEALSIARTTGNVGLQNEAEQRLLKIIQAQIDAKERLEKVQSTRAMSLVGQAAEAQQTVNEMKVLEKDILKDLAAFGKNGPQDDKALQAQGERLQKNVAALREKYMASGQMDLPALLSLDKLQQRVQLALAGGVSQVEIGRFTALPETFAAFRRQIQEGIGPIDVLVRMATKNDTKLKEELKGTTSEEAMTRLGTKLSESHTSATDYEALRRKAFVIDRAYAGFVANAMAGFDALSKAIADGAVETQMSWQGDAAVSVKRDFNTTEQRYLAIAKKFATPMAQVTDADFKELQNAYAAYVAAMKPSMATVAQLQAFERQALTVKTELDASAAAKKAVEAATPAAEQATQRIQSIEGALKSVDSEAEKLKTSFNDLPAAVGNAQQSMSQLADMDMSNIVQEVTMLTAAMLELKYAASQAVQTTSANAPSGGAVTAAKGGYMHYFDRGGFAPRGTDTIPAMLSPGEFVMNERSTRRFLGQLVAMNAGQTPVFRETGGSVTNVGDINLTVTGGNSSHQTARGLAVALQRELRRGTSRVR